MKTHTCLLNHLQTNKELGIVSIPVHLATDQNDEIKKDPRGKGWTDLTIENCQANLEKLLSSTYKPVNGLGVLTGKASGITVVDFDSYKIDPSFDQKKFEELFKRKTFTIATMRGGSHYYFKYHQSLKQTQGKNKVIDIRNDRGFVVAPPTQYGNYEYSIKDDLEIATLSTEQLKFLTDYLKPSRVTIGKISCPSEATDIIPLCLDCFSSEMRDDHQTWLKIAKVIKAHCGDDGFKILLDWTVTSPLFKSDDWVRKTYQNLEPYEHLNLNWLKKRARFCNPNKYFATIDSDEFSIDRMLDIAEISEDPVAAGVRYFDKYHIKIVDRSIQYGVILSERVLIQTKKNLEEIYLNANIPYLDDGKEKKMNVVSAWLKWKDNRTCKGITFYPDFKKPVIITPDNKLNIFRGGLHSYDEHYKIKMENVTPWLDHICKVWCDDAKILFNYTIGRLSMIIQRPRHRCPINIVIQSDPGAGKSCVFDFIGHNVLGLDHYCYYESTDSYLAGFNSEQEMCLISVLDEINSGGSSWRKSDLFKSLTTRKVKTINNKYGAKYNVPDYSSQVFLTNHVSGVVKIEEADRRYFMLKCSNDIVGDANYFKNLNGNYNTMEAGKDFFHYLMRWDLSTFNEEKIPSTDWKVESMLVNIRPVTYCILEWLYTESQGEKSPEEVTHMIFDDLWQMYINKYGQVQNRMNMSKRKFAIELKDWLGKANTTKRVEGKCVRTYIVTVDEVYNLLCKKMKCDDLIELIANFDEYAERAGDAYIKSQCQI